MPGFSTSKRRTPSNVQLEQAAKDSDKSDSIEDLANGGFYTNVFVLIFLYILQGIPLGISGAIPTLLQNAGITYHEQAVFSFAFWPFSLKLLWAPIVDTKYVKALGLRKTWILGTQLLIGAMMFFLSKSVEDLLATRQIYLITFVFVSMNFLAATQDIAVDGWALTILPKKYVGWASTCNSVGQTAGFFIGNVLLLTLESSHFANAYIRSTPVEGGFITLSGFLFFWSLFFVVGSCLVCLFKREIAYPAAQQNTSVYETYMQLYQICRLPVVKSFVLLVLTWKIGYAAAEGVTGLKLIEAGLTRDRMALLAVPLTPVQLILPLVISHISSGPKPLVAALNATFYRVLVAICFPFLVYYTHTFGGEFPLYYYFVVILIYCIHQIFANAVFVNMMAYNAQVSDPKLGGTYMTLLNTFTNLGGNWPVTLSLWLIDDLTYKQPASDGSGKIVTVIDGYHVECALCLIIGLIWMKFARPRVEAIQRMGPEAWTKWQRA